jgi:hypothetical protein
MKEVTNMKQAIIRLCAIRHGDTVTAEMWTKEIARKLIENRPLDQTEASILGSALLGYSSRGEAARLFNLGKMPHKSHRLTEDFELYGKVRGYVDAGKTRTDAIKLAGKELNYSDEFDDEWEGTATARYDNVHKTFKRLQAEVDEQQAVQNAFDELHKSFDPEIPSK